VRQGKLSRASRVEVGEVLRTADTLADPDYATAFEVTVVGAQARSAEEWARVIFEDAPPALRWFVVLGWKTILGLRLGSARSPDHVLGWKIQSKETETVVLEVCSALMTANKVVWVDASRLTVATFIRYDWRWGRAVWSAVAPVHHRTDPLLMTYAASRKLRR